MTTPLVRRSPVHAAQVVAVRELTPRMRRVTLHAPTLTGIALRPAQDVELLLRETSGRRVKRRYTIRQARPQIGELDLDVLLHGAAPGSTWAATAQLGDPVEFQGPRGKLELRPAAGHLLVGDESALPAIAAISAAVPGREPTVAVIEVRDRDDELPITPARTHWVHRGGAAPGSSALLSDTLRGLHGQGGLRIGDGVRVYLMGETRAMVQLRAVVEELGAAHDAIFVKGYWNVGRPDRLANRPPGGAQRIGSGT